MTCNVVAAATDAGATVEVFDPAVMTEFSAAIAAVADEARKRLSRMVNALSDDQEKSDATRA